MRSVLRRLMPDFISQKLELRREITSLAGLQQTSCDVSSLRHSIPEFRELDLAAEWESVQRELAPFEMGDKSGAVNPGDRRAIYYLAKALKPKAVLEVGTHLGASTSMLSLALRNSGVVSPRLVTVDIRDVNGPEGAWALLKNRHTPQQMVQVLKCDFVEFVVSPSVAFMSRCTSRFDLVFLDGGHEATTVYQEVPVALKLLNPGGLILLHDFYPDRAPLWSDGAIVPGPWLAVERFRKEGAPMKATPLGALPWPTKLGSNITSLACLTAA
jgi:predicted O-methyltransferase YrrM